jgi:hypothetical protein
VEFHRIPLFGDTGRRESVRRHFVADGSAALDDGLGRLRAPLVAAAAERPLRRTLAERQRLRV